MANDRKRQEKRTLDLKVGENQGSDIDEQWWINERRKIIVKRKIKRMKNLKPRTNIFEKKLWSLKNRKKTIFQIRDNTKNDNNNNNRLFSIFAI
jgi:DNA gyrase/topoisomerase IV subunit A